MKNCWFQEQSTVAVSETEKYDKAILQKLFPEISLADKLVGQGGSLLFVKGDHLLLTVNYCSVEANCMKKDLVLNLHF